MKKHDFSESELFTNVSFFNGEKFICKAYRKKVKLNKSPCQAVRNKIQVFSVPNSLKNLRKSSHFKDIAFQKSINNVKWALSQTYPTETVNINIFLPRQADNNG